MLREEGSGVASTLLTKYIKEKGKTGPFCPSFNHFPMSFVSCVAFSKEEEVACQANGDWGQAFSRTKRCANPFLRVEQNQEEVQPREVVR